MSGIMEILIAPTRRWRRDALRNMGFSGQGLIGKLPKGPLRDLIGRGALPANGPLRDLLKKRIPKSNATKTRKRKRRPKDLFIEI